MQIIEAPCRVITHAECDEIASTINVLSIALTEHKHRWTNQQRRAFNRAMKLLDGKEADRKK